LTHDRTDPLLICRTVYANLRYTTAQTTRTRPDSYGQRRPPPRHPYSTDDGQTHTDSVDPLLAIRIGPTTARRSQFTASSHPLCCSRIQSTDARSYGPAVPSTPIYGTQEFSTRVTVGQHPPPYLRRLRKVVPGTNLRRCYQCAHLRGAVPTRQPTNCRRLLTVARYLPTYAAAIPSTQPLQY